MNLLLDTNILILLAKKDIRRRLFNTKINPTLEKIFVSIASVSELKSIALQNNWASYTDYPFVTPRNMGKNDLWIAAAAALLGLKLITTDQDFNHLHRVFIEVECLTTESLRQ